MRSWIGARTGLAAVVMIAHVRTVSPVGACQAAHRPANANGAPVASVMCHGCLTPSGSFSHS